MKQKKDFSSNVFKSNTFFRWAVASFMMLFTMMFFSCAEETLVIPDVTPSMFEIKNMSSSTTANDSLAKSTSNIYQNSYWNSSELGITLEFQPKAYLTIELSETSINVDDETKLPIKLVDDYISSSKPYGKDVNDTIIGNNIVKIFQFDDGQVATITYDYNYHGFRFEGQVIETPHLVIDSVVYLKHSHELYTATNELEKTYKVTPEFMVYTTNAATNQKPIVHNQAVFKPWYKKVITKEPLKVESVKYEGGFIGCPIEAYEVTEYVTTNQGDLTNTYKVLLNHKFTGPQERTQPGTDDEFASKSQGNLVEEVFLETKNSDGFTIKTMSGKYTSSNTGKNSKTIVESVIDFTYTTPTKLETQYGTHQIEPIKVSFEELGFSVSDKDSTENIVKWTTTNLVSPKLNQCELDVIDEKVVLTRSTIKAPDVVKVDSTYVLTGEDDDYVVDKTIIWSDGSQTTSQYSYKAKHSISAIDFGEKITSSLDWSENSLNVANSTTKNEEKKFSDITKFVVVYTTNIHQATATNGTESGQFAFTETSPKVQFIDGSITKDFEERKFVLTGLGAEVGTTPTEIIKDRVTYNSYPYNYIVSYTWNSQSPQELTSKGSLLKPANVTGEPVYDAKQTWNGNKTTITITKTTPNSHADDVVETYKVDYTISLQDLVDGKVYANNTSFTTSQTLTNETSDEATNGYFTIKSSTKDYDFKISNNEVDRTVTTTLNDAEIIFNDGIYQKSFNVRLTLSKSESLGTTTQDGEYFVTPHTLSLQAQTVDGKTLNTSCVTDIYVKIPDAKYDIDQTWNGNTTTLKVTKTSTTADGSDVVDDYSFNFTVSLQDLVDGKVYAENTSFSTTKNITDEQTKESTDGFFSLKERNRKLNYQVSNGVTERSMSSDVRDGEVTFNDGTFSHTFDVYLTVSENESFGTTTEDGNYNVTPHTLQLKANTIDGHELSTQGRTDIYVEKPGREPEPPHLGKPTGFTVTATYDPQSKVTRRAFCFNWEDGVTYAVCDYETMLPEQKDFMFKVDDYKGYNSVAYNKNNSSSPWEPARGSDDSDAIRWYSSSSKLVSAIDKDISCKAIGWKNNEDGNYALIIKGYTYTINGYNITVTAPNGEKVTFNSHHD